jgi:hypothetical protein
MWLSLPHSPLTTIDPAGTSNPQNPFCPKSQFYGLYDEIQREGAAPSSDQTEEYIHAPEHRVKTFLYPKMCALPLDEDTWWKCKEANDINHDTSESPTPKEG